MALNRADILSRQFELPQPVEQAATARASAPAAPTMDSKYFGIPDPAEGLQWTDNTAELANRYYQRLAGIDQFAKSMWLNNKIDVTKPDYSNPQSIAASQAYQQELGNIMAIADELKQGSKALEKANEGRMAGTYAVNEGAFADPGKGFASYTPEQRGYSLNVDPQLKFIQDNTNRSVETQTDYNRLNKQAADTIARYKKIYEQTGRPEDLRNYESALRGLGATFNVQQDSGFGAQPAVSSLSEVVSLLSGAHPTFTETEKVLNGVKARKSENSVAVGADLQGKKISAVYHAKDKVYVELADADGKNKEVKEINQSNIYPYLVAVANKTGEQPQLEKFMQAAQQKGWAELNKTGYGYTFNVPIQKMLSTKDLNELSSIQFTDMGEAVKQAEARLNTDINNIQSWNERGVGSKLKSWATNAMPPTYTYDTSFGKDYKVQMVPQNGKIKISLIDATGKVVQDTKTGRWEKIVENPAQAKAILEQWKVTETLPFTTSAYAKTTAAQPSQAAQPTTSQTDW